MIEALTPQGLSIALLLIVLAAPPLALAAALVVLTLYRRAVVRAMGLPGERGAGAALATEAVASASPSPDAPRGGADILATLRHGRQRAITRICAGGVGYALVVAVAVLASVEPMRTPRGFALTFWAAMWPIVPALWIAAPSGTGAALAAAGAYFLPLGAIALIGFVQPDDFTDALAVTAALRATRSPPQLVYAWLAADGLPTALLMLVMNRWTRAVGPLVLAFTALLLTSIAAAAFAIASVPGVAALSSAADVAGLSRDVLAALLLLAALAVGGAAAWTWLRRVRHQYLAKRANDRSIALDGVWLVFATYHAMLFALVGLGWAAVGVLALVAYRLAPRIVPAAVAPPPPAPAQGLVFLRVFSLGTRTERLFDALSRHWRHCGSVQLIMGPDLARSIVQPHQILDFVSGRLERHFVADDASLRRQIAACDRLGDRDGLYRLNSLFCHADTWQAALMALVAQGDRVLMDLRSFGPANAGCNVELHHLVHRVPLARCTWIVDRRTDAAFLAQTLHSAWQSMPADSPNAHSVQNDAPLFEVGGRWPAVAPVLKRLVAA